MLKICIVGEHLPYLLYLTLMRGFNLASREIESRQFYDRVCSQKRKHLFITLP